MAMHTGEALELKGGQQFQMYQGKGLREIRKAHRQILSEMAMAKKLHLFVRMQLVEEY